MALIPQSEYAEYPYCVRVETSTGKVVDIPIAFLTAKQVQDFLQFDFKRLVQEAGVKGARLHVQRAVTADYQAVLRDISECLRVSAAGQAPDQKQRTTA